MKKNRIEYIGILMLLMVWGVSCNKSFLETMPRGDLLDSQVSNQRGVQAVLNSAYSTLDGYYDHSDYLSSVRAQPTNWIYGSARGGDAHRGSRPGDIEDLMSIARSETLPTNSYILGKWVWLLDGIAKSNNVLKVLKLTDISQEEAVNIEAQTRFLRAFYTLELRNNFNKVPWIDETIDYAENNYQVPNNEEVYPKIEEDFSFAYNNLPEIQDAVGKVNKWAAGSFLAKTYLFQQKYDQALPLLTDIIDKGLTSSGEKYGLQDQFDWNFRGAHQNSKESVFAIQYSLFDGSGGMHGRNSDVLNYPSASSVSTCCGFYQPSIELGNAYRTDNQGLPLLGGTIDNPEYDDPQHALKTDMEIASADPFTPDNGNIDPRLDWTVGRRGIPFMDWFIWAGRSMLKDQSYSGPYFSRKHIYLKSEIGQYADNGSTIGLSLTSINYNLIRFAQVLLWAAECEVEVGSLDKAQEYVNRVRLRATNPDGFLKDASGLPAANYIVNVYPSGFFLSLGKDKSRLAVRLEEKLELAMEGHRFYDLVRWGVAREVMNHFFNYEAQFTGDLVGANFTSDQDEYLPIPQTEIDLSNNTLEQNIGY